MRDLPKAKGKQTAKGFAKNPLGPKPLAACGIDKHLAELPKAKPSGGSKIGLLQRMGPFWGRGPRARPKKFAAFSAPGGGFLRFLIGDLRTAETRASVSNAGGNARWCPRRRALRSRASPLLH